MNPRRAVVAAAAAWLVVVVIGSVLAWAVISRAGEEVSGDTTGIPSTTRTGSGAGSTGPSDRTDPTDDPSSSDPTSSGSTSPSPGGKPVQRTWQGLGGFVVAECRGPAAGLIGAQADSGFVVEVKDRGPEHVDVEFEGQDDDSKQESRVRATCADGVPVFDAETDTD